jgi:hypothetical protein
MRKRVGEAYFENVMFRLLQLLSGEFQGWPRSADADDEDLANDKRAMRKASGLPISGRSGVADTTIEERLILISDRVGGISLNEVLAATSDSEIEITRNELRALLLLVNDEPKVDRSISRAFGLKVLSNIVRKGGSRTMSVMLLGLLALKEDAAFREDWIIYISNLRASFLSVVQSPKQIVLLERKEPALAQFVSQDSYTA